jgi:hypothetical protein
MASGDLLAIFHPRQLEFPASNFPTPDKRNNHPVLDFDAATDETCYGTRVMPANYGGGGVTLHALVAATTATSGAVRLQAAFERIANGGQDIDSDGFATAKSAGLTVSGTSGVGVESTIAFSNGAEMDSVVAGDTYRLSINRDADGTTGTDDATGDAELIMAWLTET